MRCWGRQRLGGDQFTAILLREGFGLVLIDRHRVESAAVASPFRRVGRGSR